MKNKHAGKVLASCVILLGMWVGSVNADTGALEINNKLNGIVGQKVAISREPGQQDYFESIGDNQSPPLMPGGYAVFSDVNDISGNPVERVDLDRRSEHSSTPFKLDSFYKGTLGSDSNDVLHFNFPNLSYTFGPNEPILFQSDRMPYGPVVDVRRAIAQNSGGVPLIDVLAGTTGEYGSGVLTIGTRLLADLDDSNEVNFEDFAIFAEDWQKGPGQYVADICGPNGIPDGYVDNYDLAAFCEDWLKDINDPSTW